MIRQLVKQKFSVGDKVKFYLARFDDLFGGVIKAVHSNDTYDIEYMSGTTKVVRKGIKSKDVFPYRRGNMAQQVTTMRRVIAGLQQDISALHKELVKQTQDNQRDHEQMNATIEAIARQLLSASQTIGTLSERITNMEKFMDEFEE